MRRLNSKRIKIILALLITLATGVLAFKTSNTIAGWDNFSTNLSPNINFFRTFSAWREYRGLGTPSDSEMSDFFRQLLSVLLGFAGLNNVFERIWVYATYLLGGYFIYKLVSVLLYKSKNYKVMSFSASIFYLFNAHTISVFSFPLLTLMTRFWVFPAILYFYLKLAQRFNYRDLFFYLFIAVAGASSFITGTYFLLLLGLLIAPLHSLKNVKKKLTLISLLILVSSFWFLNFVNYTSNYANKVANSSTFIEVNEIQLNRPVSDFSWAKTLTLFSNFYENNPTSIESGKTIYLNDLSKVYESKGILYYLLFIFPVLYVLGAIKIVLDKKKRLYWVPISLLILILLAKREAGPTGLLYQQLSDLIPSIKILLRFGDTKLHPLIAILGSISAGYFVNYIYTKFKVYSRYSLALLTLIYLLPFLTLYKGLVSPLLNVQIPKAYYEMANTINNDPDFVRVLHIPNEKISYWKPYKWGYYGSTFFAYIIDKPLIERTFEPGNTSTDLFNQKLRAQVQAEEQDINTKELHALLANSGVKYLILDNTVDNQVVNKDMLFWGNLEKENYQNAVLKLEKDGYIKKLQEYQVPISTFKSEKIVMYEVNNVGRVIESKSALGIYSNSETYNNDQTKKYLSKGKKGEVYFPISTKQDVQGVDKTNTVYQDNFVEDGFILMDVYAKRLGEGLSITLTPPNKKEASFTYSLANNYLQDYGEMKGQNYLEDWHVLEYEVYSNLRLALNDTVLPLPYLKVNESVRMGTVVLNRGNNKVGVYANGEPNELDLGSFEFTDYANCYFDSTEGYNYFLSAGKELNTTNTNGTLCVSADLTNLLNLQDIQDGNKGLSEVKIISINDSWKEGNNIPKSKSISGFEKGAISYLNSQTANNFTEFCIHNAKEDSCVNKHQFIKPNINSAATSLLYKNDSPINILISIPSLNGNERKKSFSKVEVTNFVNVLSDELYITDSNYDSVTPSYVNKVKPISPYSFYFNNKIDGFLTYTKACELEESYRNTVVIEEATIMFMQNCNNGLIIRIPYDSNTSYLWDISYNVLSGKYPKLRIEQENNLVYEQIASRYSGYPFVADFKGLQYVPDNFNYYITRNKENYFKRAVNGIDYVKNRAYIEPNYYSKRSERAIYNIEQNSQGFGAVAVKGFEIRHIPNKLANLGFYNKEKGQVGRSFGETNISYNRLSPSWWKLDIEKPETEMDVLVEFNQSYAKGWKLYRTNNRLLAFFGFKKANNVEHLMVDGWKNGYVIPYSELPGKYTLFYAPERLVAIGFIITFATLAFVAFKAFRLKK